MAKTARLGDTSTHGGAIISASPDTYVNGIKVARFSDEFSCPIHGLQTIATGSPDISINGLPRARHGDYITCGARIISGCPDTDDNEPGMPASFSHAIPPEMPDPLP